MLCQDFFMLKIIHFVQNLSLDITAGAVIMTLFLAKVLKVELSIHMTIGLAIAIWLIYTVDHLLDAKKSTGKSINPRHAFHQKHFKLIVGMALVIFGCGLWNLRFLPDSTLIFGLFLSSISGVYLVYSFYSQKPINKELFAAFVYTAGIATAPLSIVESIYLIEIFLVAQVFVLAYANLLIIPLYEHDIDIKDHHASVSTLKGASMVKQRVLLLCSLNFILFIVQSVLLKSYPFQGVVFMMTIVLFVLINRQDLFRKYQLYRILADGIFFLPAIYLWI